MKINPKLNKYSTTEQTIGTWIDGKPLYRKVVVYTGTKSNFVQIPHGISNFKEIINVSGKIADRILPTAYGATGTLNTSNYFAFIYLVNPTNIEISISNYLITSSSPIILILEYTKTTD